MKKIYLFSIVCCLCLMMTGCLAMYDGLTVTPDTVPSENASSELAESGESAMDSSSQGVVSITEEPIASDEVSADQTVVSERSEEESKEAASKVESKIASKVTSTAESKESTSANGATVYRTPSGKRYHLDPECGGKNSRAVSQSAAIQSGLTPCQKCAQ